MLINATGRLRAQFLIRGVNPRVEAVRCFDKNARRPPTYFANRPPPSNRSLMLWLGGGTAVGGAYYLSHLDTVPVTQRRRFMDISVDTEKLMAQQAYHEVMREFRHHILPPAHPYSVFVNQVAHKLIRVSGLQDLKWEVYVIDSPQKNAFVLPGGKIFVFSGLLPIAGDKDGMAAVLGHEIGHQVARHTAEKLSWSKLTVIAQTIIAFVFGGDFQFLSGLFLQLGVLLPFSRKMEVEADHIGLCLMAQACYDPRAAVGMWERMSQADKQSPGILAYVQTHPSHANRIEKIKAWLPEALGILNASDCRQTFEMFQGFRKYAQPSI
ncbi:hypothetical protein HDU90_005741 [Geranomyces variabilis]|nr:hypothetical protein HDU90_005741 [Geranomyces variabilis]